MTWGNVEQLQAGYDALARGDWDSALAPFHPDVVVEDHDLSPDGPGVDHGLDGFMRTFASVNEGFDEVQYTPERFDEVGERVLVEVRRSGRGSVSGARVEEQQFHVFDFRDGRVSRFRSFLDQSAALEAAGLPNGASDAN
jgi:hypothetical protein